MADMDVTAKFRADTSQFQNAMKGVKKDVEGVDAAAKESAKGFTILRGSIANAFGTAATSAISSVTSAVQGFVTGAIDMARESELTVRRLDQIAESMGIMDTVLGGSTKRLTDFAQELQNQTAISDETIKSAQALILTFQDVASTAGEVGGVFDRVTVAALDLSAAGFGSVEGNAKSLARALQDPLKGLTMLGRQGVTFTQEQQDLIKSLHASGRTLEAQNVILQAVEKQVGGTAAATATGAAKMSMAFKDLQEEVGLALTPLLDTLADRIRSEVIPAFEEMWREQGPEFVAALERLADISIDVAVPAVEALISRFTELAGTASNVIGAVADVSDAVSQGLGSVGVESEGLGSAMEFLDRTMNPVTKGMNILNSLSEMTSSIFGQGHVDTHANEHRNLSVAMQASSNSTRESASAAAIAERAQNALNAAHETGVRAVMEMKAGYDELNGVLSRRRAKDTAIQASKDLAKSLKDNGAAIKGTSDEALANRRAIDNVASAYVKFAEEAENPIIAQQRLEKGAKELQKTLEAAGIDPEKDPVFRSLKKQAEQGAETVGEMKKAQRDAMIAGEAVGKDFVSGIVAEAKRREADARKAGEGVGNALEAGARDATQTQSPSKVAMRIANDFVKGIVKGLRAEEAYNAAGELAQAVVRGFEDEIRRVEDLVQQTANAGIAFAEMVAKPFGTASQVMQNFGKTAGIPQIVSGIRQITGLVREANAPLVDRSIVGPAAARRNRQEMNAQLGALQSMGQHAVNLRNEYDRNLQAIEGLETAFRNRVSAINSHFDGLEDAAQASIERIQSHYARLIPQLQAALKRANDAFSRENSVLQGLISQRDQFLRQIQSGFRSFVNNLRLESARGSKEIIRETKRLANGITVTLEREIEIGGGAQSIRKALEERLKAVREFSTNIRSLMARGLDPSLVQDFISAGVAGAGDAAAALANASDEELRAINATQAGLAQEIASFQEYATQQFHDAGIAQQEAIVAPLRMAADAAQAALDTANAARDRELAAARAHLAQLRKDREAALAAAKVAHDAEVAALAAENLRLETEMDSLAAGIDKMVTDMAMTLPPKAFFAGQKSMREMQLGFRSRFPAVSQKLNAMMDRLAASMNRVSTVTVRTVFETVGAPTPRAKGGAVSASDVYLVGEKGPEIFVPGSSGTIIPNHQLGSVPSMGGAPRATGGGATINITVNAPPLTDPAEVGRQAVEAIRKYERRSGPVFVSA